MVKVFIWVENQPILSTPYMATGWQQCNKGPLHEMLIDYKHVKWFYTSDLGFFGIYAGARYMIQRSYDNVDGIGTLWRE